MKPKIFIDGREGTTGLQIHERLGARDDIALLLIDDDKRKDVSERKRLINAADLVILALPDDAAREAVALLENDTTRVIDASTAHRVAPGWAYGFAELSAKQREDIAAARFVANPGCHATGFLAIVYPLVALGLIARDCAGLTCFSLTGYSGGGKKQIQAYEREKTEELGAPGLYGLTQAHKHLSEMTEIAGLTRAPVFCPVIDDYYKGMAVTVMLPGALLGGTKPELLREAYADWYGGARFVAVAPELGSGTLYSNWGAGTNNLELTVSGSREAKTVTARFDNLGKGASGAAVQNVNLMLGFDEGAGL
ncbi:MAG: N-acetyl-gamma-glutamyl-phosphate reductase [Oscillospiraceae bacterium]|jgi:N-acetyl-gamma-glutamyl-phosphate reductase|nr:N-acetyl-gamma-glutamyl-phosphate reductase [Oscillospiraceae bacterium]